VVLAEELPTAGEGVLVEAASLLILTQLVQVIGEVMGREQGMWVVVAEDLPAAGEGVLVEAASLLILTQLVQGIGEVMRRGQGAPGYRMVFDELGRRVTQPIAPLNQPPVDRRLPRSRPECDQPGSLAVGAKCHEGSPRRQSQHTLRSFGGGNVGPWMSRDESLVHAEAVWDLPSLNELAEIATPSWEST
jgi:hypothetical protein